MTNREDCFQKNLQALETKYPELAKTIRETRVPPERYTAVLSRKGPPVMTAEGITFHSVYNPVKEGRDFIRKQKEMHPAPPGERVAVFGLGFGYHIAPLIEESMEGRRDRAPFGDASLRYGVGGSNGDHQENGTCRRGRPRSAKGQNSFHLGASGRR